METPASMRRVTRSQSSALKKGKMQVEEEAKRQPLFEITNNSPITGLTVKETPVNSDVSSIKSDATDKQTPLSGQSLLSCQVQTLIQKTKEHEKDSLDPMTDEVIISPSEQNDLLNWEFLFDSPDKSEIALNGSTDSSCLAYIDSDSHETQDPVSCSSDDSSSVWSLQVNASSEKEELDEEIGRIEEGEELYSDYEVDDEEEELLDVLCKGMNEIWIGEEIERGKRVNLPEFNGTHTRFVYNSEDEIEEQVIVLRGLPPPEGKHVRFSYEDDE